MFLVVVIWPGCQIWNFLLTFFSSGHNEVWPGAWETLLSFLPTALWPFARLLIFWRLLAAFVVLQNLKSFASLAFSVFRSDWPMFFKKWNTKCKMWKVLHHSPFPPPGQDGPSNYFNEIVASEENGLGTGKVGNASMNPTKAWFLTFHFWFAHCLKGPKSWPAYSKLLVQKT